MNRIKKYPDNNEYLFSNNMWIRNFTKNNVPYKDLNKTYTETDYFKFLENETKNYLGRYPWIDTENFTHENIIIVSDGFNFLEKQKLLEELSNVTIIGVNNSLNNWKLKKNLSYYLVNNPYKDCMKYFPRKNKNLPKCIASIRTNYEFILNYKGNIYKYCPSNEESYTSKINQEVTFQIDDYRNPICAAIQLAYRFGVEKLMLFCCDNSFSEERDGSNKLYNNLWQYPQQNIAHQLIDANLYWLKSIPYTEIKISNHSSGPIYDNAAYIKEEEILSFFK